MLEIRRLGSQQQSNFMDYISNKVHAKKYKNVYILAQGNKVPIAYQIAKGICEDKS